ncbi:YrrS family protein [Vagococcus carniphilus]|uniref:YrrS family protein n=1 Tax=Vagococcus carniphilus TaxID=218144 RepID=UPI00289156CF|nr:YrrS family protein [Vagococcus carniphilus]MDT2815842.1 YrrS family protein [Vagococcus carniphilus]
MTRYFKNNPKKAAGLFFIVCFLIFFKVMTHEKDKSKQLEIGGPKITLESSPKKEQKKVSKPKIKEESSKKIEIETKEPNAINSFKMNDWKPTSTKQNEPHRTNFGEDSIDRQEMQTAFATALNLDTKQIEEWWLDSYDTTRIYGYLSNKETNQFYKVSLKWIKNEGWLPESVIELSKLPEHI